MENYHKKLIAITGLLSGGLAFLSLILPFVDIFALFGEVTGFEFWRQASIFGPTPYFFGVIILFIGIIATLLRLNSRTSNYNSIQWLYVLGGLLIIVGDIFTHLSVMSSGFLYHGSLLIGWKISVIAGLLALIIGFTIISLNVKSKKN